MNETAGDWEAWFEHWLQREATPRVRELLAGGIRVYANCPSTQDECMRIGQAGYCCVALRQRQGRGRLGRKWDDGMGAGIAMTIALSLDNEQAFGLECLSIQAGVACCDAAERLLGEAEGDFDLGIRWPNDLLAQGRKLAGVLIETRGELAYLGIGLNVLTHQWGAELAGTAVSLQELGRQTPDRKKVISEILCAFAEVIAWDYQRLEAAFRRRDILGGRICTFKIGNRQVRGLVERIDPIRGLLVRELSPGGSNGIKPQPIYLPARTTSLQTIEDDLKR